MTVKKQYNGRDALCKMVTNPGLRMTRASNLPYRYYRIHWNYNKGVFTTDEGAAITVTPKELDATDWEEW